MLKEALVESAHKFSNLLFLASKAILQELGTVGRHLSQLTDIWDSHQLPEVIVQVIDGFIKDLLEIIFGSLLSKHLQLIDFLFSSSVNQRLDLGH